MQFQATYKHAHSEEKANKTLRVLYTKQYMTSTGMQVKSFPPIVFKFVKSIHKNQNYGLNFIGDTSASQKGINVEVKKVQDFKKIFDKQNRFQFRMHGLSSQNLFR